MSRLGAPFLAAVQALTRIPVSLPYEPGLLRAATRWFPLVGLGVGAVAAAVFTLAAPGLPRWTAACLSLAATLLLTGALHEDGLADACDGLLGGRTPADALRIMKDSRIGAFGTLGLLLVLATKLGTLAAMPDAAAPAALVTAPAALVTAPAAMIAAHAASRAAMVATARALSYARPDGMAAAVAAPAWTDVAIAAATGLGALLLLGPRAAPALGAGALAALAMGLYARRRIGGYTGDILGATQQLTELAILLAAAWHAA